MFWNKAPLLNSSSRLFYQCAIEQINKGAGADRVHIRNWGEWERAHLVVYPADFSIYKIYISDGPCLHIPYIVLYDSMRFYFSVYATISLEGVSRLCHCLCNGQLSSAVPSNNTYLSHNTSSTTHYFLCLNGVNSCGISSAHANNTMQLFSRVNHVYTTYGAFLCSSVYTSTCRFAERASLQTVL